MWCHGATPVCAQATGARVGLGTDVAGGYSPSLLVACRHAVCASRRLGRGAGSAEEVGHRRALWTATRGGAAALGLEEAIGSFARGKQFDAVVVWGGAGVLGVGENGEAAVIGDAAGRLYIHQLSRSAGGGAGLGPRGARYASRIARTPPASLALAT